MLGVDTRANHELARQGPLIFQLVKRPIVLPLGLTNIASGIGGNPEVDAGPNPRSRAGGPTARL